MKIKAIVDTAEAKAPNSENTDSKDKPDSSAGTEGSTTIVSGSSTIVKLDLVNISRADAEAFIATTDYASKVKTYGHNRMNKSIWIMGASADVNAVKSSVESYDSAIVSVASTIHTYEAKNCTVAELMNRIGQLELQGVSFYEYDHPELTSTIICYCDDITWNNEVLDALVAADTVDTGSKMWIPIGAKTGTNSDNNKAYLQNTITLMNELYPDLFGGVSIRYESFVTDEPQTDPETGEQLGGSYKTVIYAYTTSDAATRMSNYMKAIENI